MSTPLIYAELLSHIRQISVLAALPSPSTTQTHVSLSPSRELLQLNHAGKTTCLQLPAEISRSYTPLQPQPGLLSLSWRIPLAPTDPPRDSPDSTAPWAATDLSPSSAFVCRGCSQVVLPPGKIATWRDLPGENWADMMDFWHCHKPSEPKTANGGGANLASKGYGANTKFVAQKGVGKVALMYFLLSDEDCEGIEISQQTTSQSTPPDLLCTNPSCHAHLGIYDPISCGYRLDKWSLSLSPSPSPSQTVSSPPLAHFLLPHLASLTATLAVSKFIIRSPPRPSPTPPSEPANIYTWRFAPNLTISLSSSSSPPPPQHASKLLYRLLPAASADKLLDAPDGAVEEVRLPAPAPAALLSALVRSNAALPEGARRFGEWAVGVLERG